MTSTYAPTCVACGSSNLGTRFCENCGQPAVSAESAVPPTPALVPSAPIYQAPIPASAVVPGPQMSAPVPGYGYAPRTNTLAVLSLVFGLLGGAFLPIIFGHIAKSQIRRTGERGDGLATAGLIFGYLWLIVVVIVIIATISSASRYR